MSLLLTEILSPKNRGLEPNVKVLMRNSLFNTRQNALPELHSSPPTPKFSANPLQIGPLLDPARSMHTFSTAAPKSSGVLHDYATRKRVPPASSTYRTVRLRVAHSDRRFRCFVTRTYAHSGLVEPESISTIISTDVENLSVSLSESVPGKALNLPRGSRGFNEFLGK